MIGNTLSEFIDDILTMGGPEKEFLFPTMKPIGLEKAENRDSSFVMNPSLIFIMKIEN